MNIMSFHKTISNVLASKRTFYLLLSTWVGVIILSNFLLPPSDDGKFYFEPALGFKYKSAWGYFMGEEFFPRYIMFPTFPYFQSLFLWIMSFFNIPLNVYTYRLFHLLLILALLLLNHYFIYLIHIRNNSDFLTHSNMFLVLLSITPFAQNCWQLRPEVFGILLLINGLICYRLWDLSEQSKDYFLYASAFFIGLSGSSHPNFAIAAGSLVLIILILQITQRIRIRTMLFGIIASIPLSIIVIWMFSAYPESVQQFKAHMDYNKSFNAGALIRLIEEALIISHWGSVQIKIFYAMFWFPLFFLLIYSICLLLKKGKRLIKSNNFSIIIISTFVIILVLLIINRGTDSYFTIYSFFIVLFYSFCFTINKPYNKKLIKVKKYSSNIISFLLIFLILLHSSIHAIKFIFGGDRFYFAPKAYHAITKELTNDDTLFVGGRGKQAGLFYEYLEAKYRGDKNATSIFMIEPVKSWDKDRIIMRKFIKNKIVDIYPEKTVWGVRFRESIYDQEHNRLIWKPQIIQRNGLPSFSLHFNIKDIIYKDKDNLFFRPNLITVQEKQL